MARATKEIPVSNISTARIARSFQRQLKQSNIPVFVQIASETTLPRYFLNRSLYMNILGDNIFIADRFIHNAIVDEIVPFLKDMCEYYRLPGISIHDITATAKLCVNILPSAVDESKMYLHAEPIGVAPHDIDDNKLYPEGSFMEFSEFNPRRLRQIVVTMQTSALNTIIREIGAHYPTMRVCTPNADADDIIVQLLQDMVSGSLLNSDILSKLDQKPSEKLIMEFIDAIEKPFMQYVFTVMLRSGVSRELIQHLFETVELHVLYQTEADILADASITYVFAFPRQQPANGSTAFLQIPFEFTVSEIINIAQSGDGCKGMTKMKIKQFATKVKALNVRLCQSAIAMAVNQYVGK